MTSVGNGPTGGTTTVEPGSAVGPTAGHRGSSTAATLEAAGATDSSDFWSVPIEALLARLGSMPTGISDDEAARRLALYGPNIAAPRAEWVTLRELGAQFKSPIAILLLAAATLSLALGDRTEGGIILGIFGASALLGFWQEHRASSAVQRLLAMIHTTSTVTRSGRIRDIPLEQVVPGDIVHLAAGANIPGDARLLDAKDLFVDQAALTGESYPAEKHAATSAPDAPIAQRVNAVYLGTHVVSGAATAVVVETGARTEFGAIAARLATLAPPTEFELGVRHFGYLLLEIAMALVIVIFAINVSIDRPVLEALLFTLALAVGLTPQLLPAIVSVTLAQGARRMARERVLVRRLVAIEDLGGMEILCTDKTGTITEGVVTVSGAVDHAGAPSAHVRLLAYLNAAFETGYPNPIDDALRAVPPPGADAYRKDDEVPYDFVRKRLSVVARDGGRRLLITKGALASVLDICDTAEDAQGAVVPLDGVRAAIETAFAELSRQGFRCLGVAYRALSTDHPVNRADETGLTFAGILSLTDPLKAGATESLGALHALGIRLTLVTGDNRHVATRLAREAGLDTSTVCTGDELRHLSEAALVGAAPRIGVFAELDPAQKERVILALRKAGYSVGYLGDGINDAAALHAADVGISVDSATAVTKQAADIVLLEKDLAVLGRGVREGRRAFANTLKYVFITTSANFGNMVSMAVASLFAGFLPLLPSQILLINVLTDAPAMAITSDHLDPEQVQRPRRWDTKGVRHFMVVFGLVSSLFDLLTFALLLAVRAPAPVFRTAWFMESVLSELGILLVIRTRRPFFRSRPGRALFWTSVGVAGLTLLIPFSPLAAVLGFAPLAPGLLLLVAAVVTFYIIGSELTKRMLLRRVIL
jgi:Mg2+-importing ATPase